MEVPAWAQHVINQSVNRHESAAWAADRLRHAKDRRRLVGG